MKTKKQKNDFVPINTWRLLNSFEKKQKIMDKIVKFFREYLIKLKI